MLYTNTDTTGKNATVVNPTGASSVVLICEHASHYIPPSFDGLGLSSQDRESHAAWDPGALAVATQISMRLDAVLIAAQVSRLVYDCNRPPEAIGAMPERSEVIEVPGNRGLSDAARQSRVDMFYHPFHSAVTKAVAAVNNPIIVTIHSFTPVYHGVSRAVEIGVLHDRDTRLADAMLGVAASHTTAKVMRNDPYGPDDGVTHSLQKHGANGGHLNVMLEVRNDLIATADQQTAMGDLIAAWIADACVQMNVAGDVQCRA